MSRVRKSDAPLHRFKGCFARSGDAEKRQAFALGIDRGRDRRSHAKGADCEAVECEQRLRENRRLRKRPIKKEDQAREIPEPER